ncbi:endo alpha-1,4 polygalactosaminidase [Leifsonia kafniensis]|uniref:Endo alpha-1,4 polygalactosaminidase n=1 Tax=Leifsonia kafniensis TaxID=475957 RepID=A0ABP7L4Q2_9MICO
MTGCSAGASDIVLPPAGGVADYQLGGSYSLEPEVRIVARDSTETPAAGLYSICYLNGFQSQPGAEWPRELLLTDASGAPLADPGWPDEYLFDISTAANRDQLSEALAESIRGCASDGFQAVEFDNFDSYTRSAGALTQADAVAFATDLVAVAHTAGLAAGQKNAPDLAAEGATSIGFDFAVAEECFRYQECASYTDAYGQHVIDVEYADDVPATFAEVCASGDRPESLMLRDHNLTVRGTDGYVYQHC